MAARGPVILRAWPRNRFLSADKSCRLCACACRFIALPPSPPWLPKSSRLVCADFPTPGERNLCRRTLQIKKPPGTEWRGAVLEQECLLHQQHLAGAFDGLRQTALIMGRQAGVFARQNAALVG